MNTSFHNLARNGRLLNFKLLQENSEEWDDFVSNLFKSADDQKTLFETIMIHNSPDVVSFIAQKANVKDRSTFLNYMLMIGVRMDQSKPENVEALLQSGADVKYRDKKYGMVPLHWAAYFRSDLVNMLIAAGADVNASQYNKKYKTEDNYTPLHAAAQRGNEESVRILLKNGADKYMKNSYGKTPAEIAMNMDNSSKNIINIINDWESPA